MNLNNLDINLVMQVGAWFLQILIYVALFSRTYGTFKTKLEYLEEKMEKHNKLQDRMAVVEQSAKSAHKRLDELKTDIREEHKHED